jgi:hypothetical protein
MSAATDLQATINRFAASAGFTSIGVDGNIGSATAAALFKALAAIGSDTASGLSVALVTDSGAIDIAAIKSGAAGLAVFLGQAADEGALPPPTVAITVTPKPGASLNPVNILKNQNAIGAGLLGLGLPNWAVYGGGAAFVLSMFLLIRGRKKRG